MSMSAVLKEAGHDVQLTIAAQEDPIQLAKSYQPDIIGFSMMTGSQHYYFKLNFRYILYTGKIRCSDPSVKYGLWFS